MQVFESAKGLWSAILQQFRWESHTPKRTLDEIEILCSVFLAILFAHYFGAENIGWAAFSGYMVLRSHIVDTCILVTDFWILFNKKEGKITFPSLAE